MKQDDEINESFTTCPQFAKCETALNDIHNIKSNISSLLTAFPNKDVKGHCDYHDAKIKAAEAEERFWNELKLDLAKKGVWGLLIVLSGLIVIGLTAKLGMGVVK